MSKQEESKKKMEQEGTAEEQRNARSSIPLDNLEIISRLITQMEENRMYSEKRILELITENNATLERPKSHVMPDLTKSIHNYQGEESTKAKEWLTQLNSMATLHAWPAEFKLETARSHLTGTALNWYRARSEEISNWQEFEARFRKTFIFEENLTDKWENMKSRKQKANENVTNISMLPEFKGETELLPRFIEICEKRVTKFADCGLADVTDFQNEYLMSSILAKIKGEAAINIASRPITNWTDLKTSLLNTYQDKRDCYKLGIEMTYLKQGQNENPFDFYNRIQKLLNLQISYVTTHINIAEAGVLAAYFGNYALRVLLKIQQT